VATLAWYSALSQTIAKQELLTVSTPSLKDPNRPLRIAVLISGGGTTLRNFIEKIAAGKLKAEILLVVSSTPKAGGLQHAEKAGIPSAIIRRRDFDSQDAFSAAVFDRSRHAGVDLVVMGGFLKRVTIPEDFANRVVNIHPALIPSFCGEGMYGHVVHEAVLEYGAKLSGCTVHFADNQYDHGPVIMQKAVPVMEDDTPETLAARVFKAECEAYPEVLNLIAAGRVTVEGRRVRIAPA
jgi:phosphoribosylglycinamide formyltransferase-1